MPFLCEKKETKKAKERKGKERRKTNGDLSGVDVEHVSEENVHSDEEDGRVFSKGLDPVAVGLNAAAEVVVDGRHGVASVGVVSDDTEGHVEEDDDAVTDDDHEGELVLVLHGIMDSGQLFFFFGLKTIRSVFVCLTLKKKKKKGLQQRGHHRHTPWKTWLLQR